MKKVFTQKLSVEITIVTDGNASEDAIDYAVHSTVESLPKHSVHILASDCMVYDHGEASGQATYKTPSQIKDGDYDRELGL
tara:strand:+ start:63 stop:305 length:243 start_codon:yes stop_codon:yes gene_type:complete